MTVNGHRDSAQGSQRSSLLKLAHRDASLKRPPPSLGHDCKSEFVFEDGYTSLGSGAFGACPAYVMQKWMEHSLAIESKPEAWLLHDIFPKIFEARKRVASLVGVSKVENLALVPNATTAVNAVLGNIDWKAGDVILSYSTTYGGCRRVIHHTCDKHGGVEARQVDLILPMTYDAIVEASRQALEAIVADGKRPRLALIDGISSMPAARMPFERLVQLCREYNCLTLVDSAHGIGQISLDLDTLDADFFTSNLHKWASAHRAVALLYVPQRNHKLGASQIISWNYQSTKYPPPPSVLQLTHDVEGNSKFSASWDFLGTTDPSNYLAVTDALDWRAWLGGEDKIMAYTHSLAVEAATRLAQMWGTHVLNNVNAEQDGQLVASMANIALPLYLPHTGDGKDRIAALVQTCQVIEREMERKYKTGAAFFHHNDQLYTRICANVYLQLEEFLLFGERILQLCQELRLKLGARTL